MSLAGLLLGLINIAIVLAILVLIGAIIVWIASIFQWPIPWNIQRLYLLIVLLIGIYMIVALLFGLPSPHIIHLSTGGSYGFSTRVAARPS